jgi:effector-binding domain-containing protein
MNLLKKLLLGVAVILVLCVGVGLFLPRTAHVERFIVINARPATVFTVLNGFRQFAQWSPWAEYDPHMKLVFEGPAAGVGARYSWTGNEQVGTGSQEILESTPYRFIKLKLVFGDFPGEFVSSYTLEPEGEGTRLIWAFDADYGNSVMGRYFGLLSDSMIGPDYVKGLARLKSFAETLPTADFSGLSIEPVEAKPMPIVSISARSADETYAIGVALGVAYSRLSGFINANELKQVAPPLAIYHGSKDGVLTLDAAIPVDRTDVAPAGSIHTGQTQAGSAVRAEYKGPYSGLPVANEQVRAYLVAAGFERDGAMWEQYVSDPSQTPQADLVTHIYYPVK